LGELQTLKTAGCYIVLRRDYLPSVGDLKFGKFKPTSLHVEDMPGFCFFKSLDKTRFYTLLKKQNPEERSSGLVGLR